jgi:hypothetical protein
MFETGYAHAQLVLDQRKLELEDLDGDLL